MDFLNKAFAHVSDLFRSMTPGARITTGLLLAAIVVGISFLFRYQGTGPEVDLFSGTPIASTQVAQIEAAFAKKGLNDYEVDGNRIRIPRGQRDAYLAAVAEARALPPNFETWFDDALDGTSSFSSRDERETRLKLAKQKTLAMIIGQMSGIESASVIYDIDVNRYTLNRNRTITATAAVKPMGNEQLNESQVASIRSLVAGAIAGLRSNEVTVADLNGPTWHGNPESGGTTLIDEPYAARKRMYEQEWEAKILNALAYVPGVKVTPNVELDRERERTERRVQHDPKPVIVQQAEESASRTREGAAPGGRPGYVAQQPNTPVQLNAGRAGGSREDEEESKMQTVALTSGTQQETVSVGLTPRRVSVSVAIPSGYFQKIWRERHQGEDAAQAVDEAQLEQIRTDETTKIRRLVANLLPPADGVEDRTELVEIMTFQGFTPEEIPGPTYGDQAVTWLAGHWSTVGILLVAAISLLMLRSMIVASPAERAAAELFRGEEGDGDETDREAAAAAASRLSRFHTTGRSLRDEVSELVQEDPDAAANILKAWIGHVG
ncbi:MAG: flagellar M-ring protein FliF C-terminal domain-containing protein [Patescibacteria group bacterium]|nr:flagellar M-ring protein FliF C-terminal domain-containing protein [Patescibacteria group bacterium]